MKEFESFGYSVTAELHQSKLSVDFKVYKDSEVFSATMVDAPKPVYVPFFIGTIKWDGCSNWHFPHNVHFCSRKEAEDFGLLISSFYEIAAELMPSHLDILNKDYR